MQSCLNYRPKNLTVKDNGKNITLQCWERDLFIFRLIGSPFGVVLFHVASLSPHYQVAH